MFLLGKEHLVSPCLSDLLANLPLARGGTGAELPPLGFITLDRNPVPLAELGTGTPAQSEQGQLVQ